MRDREFDETWHMIEVTLLDAVRKFYGYQNRREKELIEKYVELCNRIEKLEKTPHSPVSDMRQADSLE